MATDSFHETLGYGLGEERVKLPWVDPEKYVHKTSFKKLH